MNELFQAYCNYGTRAVTTGLDGAKFVKIFKDSGLVGKGLIATDLDIIYSKVPSSSRFPSPKVLPTRGLVEVALQHDCVNLAHR